MVFYKKTSRILLCTASLSFLQVPFAQAVDYSVPPDLADTLTLSNVGDTLTVEVGGTIDTNTGSGGDGVYGEKDSQSIFNYGTIIGGNPEIGRGVGIYASGSNTIIVNHNLIKSAGRGAIRIDGTDTTNNSVTNYGKISSSGSQSIYFSGSGASLGRVLNYGDIVSSRSQGIYLSNGDGYGFSIDNFEGGRIWSTRSQGVYFSQTDGAHFTLKNHKGGQIWSTTSQGVYLSSTYGYQNTVINHGEIWSTADYGVDVNMTGGQGNRLFNYGSIRSTAEAGVLFSNDYSDPAGVEADILADHHEITEFVASENQLFNYGLIESTVSHAVVFDSYGRREELTNAGTLRAAAGFNAIEIDWEMAGSQITLLAGSILEGGVALDSPDDTLNIGTGLNLFLEFEDTLENLNSAVPFVVDANTLHTIDGTGFVAADQGVADLGAQVLAAIDRLGHRSAATGGTQGTAGADGFAWGGAIGAAAKDGATDTTASYRAEMAGMIGGYTFGAGSGLFLGVTTTRQETSDSFEADTDTAFAGLYGGWQIGSVSVDASLTAGLGSTEQTRIIANNTVVGGLETADADYDTAFVMPAATFRRDMDSSSDSFTPSVRLRYARIMQDGYGETGTAMAPLSVEDRDVDFFEFRFQLERGLEDKRVGDATLNTLMRAGFDVQMFSGDDVNLTVVDQALNFGAHNDDTVGRLFVGSDMVRLGDDGSELTVGFEAGIDANDRVDVSGGVQWELSF